MSHHLRSIVRNALGVYSVVVESDDGTTSGAFVISVSLDEVEAVTWDDEFVRYVHADFVPATPIMKAVLAFHRAQSLALSRTS